jgi:hypothetical protein
MWVVIHMCMQAMLRISLYRYFNLKLEICYFFLIISPTKLEKKRAKQFLARRGSRERGGGGPNNVLTCK